MSQAEDDNLGTVHKIGCISSDNGLRKALDGLDHTALRAGFAHLDKHVKATELLQHYHVWQDYVAVSVDGEWSVSAPKRSLARAVCSAVTAMAVYRITTAMLCAALVKPGLAEVLPRHYEPMTQ